MNIAKTAQDKGEHLIDTRLCDLAPTVWQLNKEKFNDLILSRGVH